MPCELQDVDGEERQVVDHEGVWDWITRRSDGRSIISSRRARVWRVVRSCGG